MGPQKAYNKGRVGTTAFVGGDEVNVRTWAIIILIFVVMGLWLTSQGGTNVLAFSSSLLPTPSPHASPSPSPFPTPNPTPTPNFWITESRVWNLVSFNLRPVSTAITDVLSGLVGTYDLAYAWNGQGQGWLKYDNIPMSSDTLNTLDETMGFWIHTMSTAQTLSVAGNVPTITQINLSAAGLGWNLIGYPSVASRNLPDALSDHGVGTDFSLVYAYQATDTADPWKLFDRTAPIWSNDLFALSPDLGYWVQVSVTHTLTVTYPAP